MMLKRFRALFERALAVKYWVFLLFCLVFFECRAEDFATSAEWLALGHYQNNKSSIDSPNFFLASDGKINPVSELSATVKLFDKTNDEKKCMFPARYIALKKKGLINSAFPKCDEFEEFKNDLQPAGITLLFTDAYMNNPSSMFGHTLFRIDTKRKGTQLLAHGANYGAFTGDEPGALYAVLGLTGGYFGGFTVKPYYDIINTYNNIENRDIWELNLNLTQEELDFFVAHLWEIGQTQSRYYFFTKNCSYMLMEMLDAVRPSLKLAQKFPVQAIPLDTFKAVYRTNGLVKNVNYRPSRQNKILHRYKMMDNNQKNAFLKALKDKNYELSDELKDEEKADIWETAYQYVQYQYVAEKMDLKDYRKQSFDILRSRSKIKTDGNIEEKKDAPMPVKAHDAMRAVVATGIRNGEVFQEIAYRPAYQSLTDSHYGLSKGAEINFLETSFRHYDNQDKYVLQNLDLITIRSISPINAMFNPVSFQIKANIERWQNPINEDDGYVGNLVVGTGGAYAFTDWLWGFVMFDTKISYGGFLPHNSAIGLEADAGLLVDFDKWKVLAEIKPQWMSQKIGQVTDYNIEMNYMLDDNLAIGSKFLYGDRYGNDVEEFSVGLRLYF